MNKADLDYADSLAGAVEGLDLADREELAVLIAEQSKDGRAYQIKYEGSLIEDLPSGHMTREEFEQGYADRSKSTLAKGYELGIFPALPCDCGDESCEGWRRRYSDDEEG